MRSNFGISTSTGFAATVNKRRICKFDDIARAISDSGSKFIYECARPF